MIDRPEPTGNTNPPQHMVPPAVSETPGAEDGAHRQTGVGTAPPELDAADPHPSDEGDPYDERRAAGSSMPRAKDIGPNPAIHNGTAPHRPQNVETDPTPRSEE